MHSRWIQDFDWTNGVCRREVQNISYGFQDELFPLAQLFAQLFVQ